MLVLPHCNLPAEMRYNLRTLIACKDNKGSDKSVHMHTLIKALWPIYTINDNHKIHE